MDRCNEERLTVSFRDTLVDKLTSFHLKKLKAKSSTDMTSWLEIAIREGYRGYATASLLSLVNEFNSKGLGECTEHPQHTIKAWKFSIANEGELGGYWRWVERQIKLEIPQQTKE